MAFGESPTWWLLSVYANSTPSPGNPGTRIRLLGGPQASLRKLSGPRVDYGEPSLFRAPFSPHIHSQAAISLAIEMGEKIKRKGRDFNHFSATSCLLLLCLICLVVNGAKFSKRHLEHMTSWTQSNCYVSQQPTKGGPQSDPGSIEDANPGSTPC